MAYGIRNRDLPDSAGDLSPRQRDSLAQMRPDLRAVIVACLKAGDDLTAFRRALYDAGHTHGPTERARYVQDGVARLREIAEREARQ